MIEYVWNDTENGYGPWENRDFDVSPQVARIARSWLSNIQPSNER